MKRVKELFWPILGLGAVLLSLEVLYSKLWKEALEGAADDAARSLMQKSGLFESLGLIITQIGGKLTAIPMHGYLLAALSTLFAYWALAWYDRIALIHLKKTQGISWLFITLCSFVTYAISHNIGGSVFSGGMVRYRAYTSKGLSAAEVAVLVALCSFTFAFGTILLGGAVLVLKPFLLKPMLPLAEPLVMLIGAGMIAFCLLYTIGAWLKFNPLVIKGFKLEYPGLHIVWRQWIAAPMELLGAAGIIYFALPEQGNPGFIVVLGAFLLSFAAGLLLQVPGGVGVMEGVFLALMPSIPASEVFAALLVWRLFYLLIPLALSLPVVLLFERGEMAKKKAAEDVSPA
ncbi:COG0392 Predicted integral membrane protein [Rhabdaerophilaceae bacterium]